MSTRAEVKKTGTQIIEIPHPGVAPFGVPLVASAIQEVWDVFVKPDQDAGNIQSIEMRCLMAVLRSVHQGLLWVEEEK